MDAILQAKYYRYGVRTVSKIVNSEMIYDAEGSETFFVVELFDESGGRHEMTVGSAKTIKYQFPFRFIGKSIGDEIELIYIPGKTVKAALADQSPSWLQPASMIILGFVVSSICFCLLMDLSRERKNLRQSINEPIYNDKYDIVSSFRQKN